MTRFVILNPLGAVIDSDTVEAVARRAAQEAADRNGYSVTIERSDDDGVREIAHLYPAQDDRQPFPGLKMPGFETTRFIGG